jgi:hypothetical protein
MSVERLVNRICDIEDLAREVTDRGRRWQSRAHRRRVRFDREVREAHRRLRQSIPVAARTEQCWCPIKHARAIPVPHSRYHLFVDYGDAKRYHRDLRPLREALRYNPARRGSPVRSIERARRR